MAGILRARIATSADEKKVLTLPDKKPLTLKDKKSADSDG
jgi:hypothetical protein